jgi:hypothetical protein
MGARNGVEIVLSCRPTRLHRLAESIPWNQFLAPLRFKNTISGMVKKYEGFHHGISSLLLKLAVTKKAK